MQFGCPASHHKGSVIPAKAGIQSNPHESRKSALCLSHGEPPQWDTLYTGVTSDLTKRVWEHKHNVVEGFTKRYGVHQLVWYEPHPNMESAIHREKTIKEWKRQWKLELIEALNPDWQDLFEELV